MDGAERTDTMVIGAGPAGLAVGACLQRAGVPVRILEASERLGSSWEAHYRRLHLHTDAARSALPFRRFPRGTPTFPSRDQVVAYLRGYADAFDLRPALGERVVAAERVEGRWRVRTERGGMHEAARLVVATGAAARPYWPPLPGLDAFRGRCMHSRDYRDGAPFAGQRVLVVGGGNSGAEIALDLWEHGARPTLSVGGGFVVVPRRLLGLPLLSVALPLALLPPRAADALVFPIRWFLYRDLGARGVPPARHGPFVQAALHGRVPVIDVGTVRLIRRGALAVRRRVARLEPGRAVFADGRAEPFDAVVLATGYRPDLAFLRAPEATATEAAGPGQLPARHAPTARGARDLYFCGFRVVPTGMLREIGREARGIAADIASRRRAGGAARSDTLGP